MINRINSSDIFAPLENQRRLSKRQEEAPAASGSAGSIPEDRTSLGSNQKEILTYTIPRTSPLIASDFKSLQEMLIDIFEQQGIMVRTASEGNVPDLKDTTPEKARELVSEDGYLGIEQTSDRIVQFAISISGNDPARLEELKASIEKGFKQASEALGGELPEISMKTYDAIMGKLDTWSQNSGISV